MLIVEDDGDIRQVLAAIVESAGYLVETAHDGVQALERLRSGPHCLIIFDLMMPGMNGWDLAKHLKADADLAKIPTVILTARNDVADVQAALAPAAIIRKPFDADEVLKLLERFCP